MALLALTTSIVFSTTNLDLTVARFFVVDDGHGQSHWPWSSVAVVKSIYRFGIWPIWVGIALTVAVAVLALVRRSWSTWRQPAIFVILSVLLGPGLLVNGLSKDHVGRPRPREVIELGGSMTYASPARIQPASKGKGFPCGHSSMGFALACVYLLYRRSRPWLAWSWLALGLTYGIILGMARICVGAHFLSDVLWSAYMPFLVAIGVWYMLKPTSRGIEPPPMDRATSLPSAA